MSITKTTMFHDHLKELMNSFVHEVYDSTQNFPTNEQYGVVSQLRRASLSIILNYVEGFARKRSKVMKNFYETAYGSLKETEYLIFFSLERGYLIQTEYDSMMKKINEIGKMLWSTIDKIK